MELYKGKINRSIYSVVTYVYLICAYMQLYIFAWITYLFCFLFGLVTNEIVLVSHFEQNLCPLEDIVYVNVTIVIKM